MGPSVLPARWSARARSRLTLLALGLLSGAIVLGAAFVFVTALGALAGLAVLAFFVAMAAYTLWTHEPAAQTPP